MGFLGFLLIIVAGMVGKILYENIVGEKDIEEQLQTREGESVAYYHLSKIAGEWKRNGTYNLMTKDDTPVEIGKYRNGQKEGGWLFSVKGILSSKAEFSENRLNGTYEEYRVDGNVRTKGQYRNDCKEGLWKSYHFNKKLQSVTSYSAGVREGPFVVYFENGVVGELGQYRNDKPDSVWTSNTAVGIPNKKSYYENGLLVKEETIRDNGTISCKRTFHLDGTLESERYMDESGNDMISHFIGTYRNISEDSNQDISTETMILKSNGNLVIESTGQYLRRKYFYTQDRSTIFESTDNVKGTVKVTSDSIYFTVQLHRKYPSRMFAPALENRGWIDDSDKEWSESTDGNEAFSIEEFLLAYRKVR